MVTAWLAAAVVGLGSLLAAFLFLYHDRAWGKQQRMRQKLKRQGIGGPPPSFLYGNIPDMKKKKKKGLEEKMRSSEGHEDNIIADNPLTANYVSSLFPYLDLWRDRYGPIFTYSTGRIQVLNVSRADIIKQIGQYKSLNLGKPPYLQKEFGPLFGHGIMTSNGALWIHQRKVIAPEFFMDKVKGMINLMVVAMKSLVKTWFHQIECGGGTGEITVDDELRSFSADIIARACFGSSCSQGKEIFLKLRDLQKAISKPGLLSGTCGMSHLPKKSSRQIWKMEHEIRLLILSIIKERRNMVDSHEKDLLQSILEGASSDDIGPGMMESFMVDNCKNIYFAGHETVAVSATWCLMLLAANPHWQARARVEAEEICKGQFPDVDMLKKMKVLTMVIQETLRLYPIAAFVTRGALEDLKLGDLLVPEGINIEILIPTLHRNPEIWGPDVHEFKPERFSQGITGACKLPHTYIPFGLGARSCVGQNFAMVELKVALSIILSKFIFSLSPKYCHSPVFRLTVEPEFGMPLIMKKL